MGKLDEKKKKKKETLFESSFDLFTSKGFSKTSISDIVTKAGVAKGTFYLYFKDKYDIQNRLIAYKASNLFEKAFTELNKSDLTDFSDKLIFIADYIIDELIKDKSLLKFISKNLSWGVFKSALIQSKNKEGFDFYDIYLRLVAENPRQFLEPEVMLFMIIELTGSTIYSAILYGEPLPIEQYKPYLYRTIRTIIESHASK